MANAKFSDKMFDLVKEHKLQKDVDMVSGILVNALDTVGNKGVYVDFVKDNAIPDNMSIIDMASYFVLRLHGHLSPAFRNKYEKIKSNF